MTKEEQRPVHLVWATPDDAGQLTVVQGRAFLDDRKWMPKNILSSILAMDDPQPGSPGCTSVEWNRRAIENERVTYYKILLGDRIVGGLILFDNGGGEWELGRIYIDPDYQNRAIGQHALLKMYQFHPDVKRWRLGTPEWATRNQHFYQKMGFHDLGGNCAGSGSGVAKRGIRKNPFRVNASKTQ